MTFVNCFDVSNRCVMALIGCGGKTSLINLLAEKLKEIKVLVSTTTKIFPLNMEGVTLCQTLHQCEEHVPRNGIQCMGLLNQTSGKLESLPASFLKEVIPGYDIVLLEADGSKGLPCKGWLENEPVVPPYCTHTIGVVTMGALGKMATEAIVQRLPEFLALTGLKEGGIITEKAMEAMVCSSNGMFRNSIGKRYLVVNQIEDEETAHTARSFLLAIKEKYPDRFKALLYGSVHLDNWQAV